MLKLKEHKHNKLFSVNKLKAVGLIDPTGEKPNSNGRKENINNKPISLILIYYLNP